MALAFEGIRVVDFTQVLSGPFATYQLALLGADVIKVESAGGGDIARPMLDPTGFGHGMLSPIFLGVNSNKRSLAVDLKREEGRRAVARLVETCDVLVQNFRPGVIERLGFGYPAVKQLRPDILYCAVSGYGLEGPSSHAAAFDGAIQAASGLMATNGHPETGPTRTGSPIVDVAAGFMAAFAIASALHRRQRTGEGQLLDVAMLDSAVTLLNPVFNSLLSAGVEPELLGNQSPTRLPTADVFPTRDGWVQVTVITQSHVRALLELLGKSALLEDPRFSTEGGQREHGKALKAELAAVFQTEPTAEWLERLRKARLPVAPIARLPEVLSDPQLAFRRLTATLAAPAGLGPETVTTVTTGFVADADGPHVHHAAPLLGAHSEEVLAGLGYSREEIRALLDSGVVVANSALTTAQS